MTRCLTVTVLSFVGRPFWREDGSVFCIGCWPLLAQNFLGPSPLVLATIFYCLRFETSLFVASYDSQGHGVGIRPRLHTGTENCSVINCRYIASTSTTQKTASTVVEKCLPQWLHSNSHSMDSIESQLCDSYLTSRLAHWVLPSSEL
jgi:hypothetical protein